VHLFPFSFIIENYREEYLMEDLIGKTFGRWKVLEKSPIRSSDNRI
jgi:hypothetical protein